MSTMENKKKTTTGIKKRKRYHSKPVKIGADGRPIRPRLMRDIIPQIHSHPGWATLPQNLQFSVDMIGNRGHLYHIIYSVWDFLFLGTPLPPDVN